MGLGLCGDAGAEVVIKDSSGAGLSEVLSLFELDMPWVGALGGAAFDRLVSSPWVLNPL